MKKIWKWVCILLLLTGCTKTLSDGTYSVNVEMSGGTGRASIQSPAQMVITEGKSYVEVEWSSPYYDYMIVDGITYYNEAQSGNSKFTIPVQDLNQALEVIADTTAMSVPHEIEYTLNFKME